MRQRSLISPADQSFPPGTLEIYKMLTGWNALQATWNQPRAAFRGKRRGQRPDDRDRAVGDRRHHLPELPVFHTGPNLSSRVQGTPGHLYRRRASVDHRAGDSAGAGWAADPASNQGSGCWQERGGTAYVRVEQ